MKGGNGYGIIFEKITQEEYDRRCCEERNRIKKEIAKALESEAGF